MQAIVEPLGSKEWQVWSIKIFANKMYLSNYIASLNKKQDSFVSFKNQLLPLEDLFPV